MGIDKAPLSARTSRVVPARPLRDGHATTRAEHEAQKRKKEHAARFEQLQKMREQDAQHLSETIERANQAREQKFQEGLAKIAPDNPQMVDAWRKANEVMEEFDMKQERKRDELYEKWDAQVYRRVEYHVLRYMSKSPPELPEGFRPNLLPSDDPLKGELRLMRQEENFHRAAQSILQGPLTKEELKERRKAQEAESSRNGARPMLPVEQWEQMQHYATPYGKFPQACANQNEWGTFHSARRIGPDAHRIPIEESDGVPTAGKVKTRYERNHLGMLSGDVAREGESAQYKNGHGGGSAAPCQDHYHYEQGMAVVAREYPAGKRAYPGLKV